VIFIGSEFTRFGGGHAGRRDAAVAWPWKLIVAHDEPEAPGEYYNLADDPAETRPLPEDARAAALRAALREWNAAGKGGSALAAADAADLRALGYIR